MKKQLIITPLENTGLIPAPDGEKDYRSKELFGAVGQNILGAISPLTPPPDIFKDGKGWLQVAKDYGLPEKQFNEKFDTFSCVVYSIAKATCYYLFKAYDIKITISEMYNAFFAKVVQNHGTTIAAGMESFRKNGWVSDADYPFLPTTTAAEFFRKPPKEIILKAHGVLTEWEFHWEVLPAQLQAIFEAYKKTPVVLTGFAWASYLGEGVYYDYNNRANHAFLGLEASDNGNNICDDTYPRERLDNDLIKDDMLKELHKSFKYGSAHRVWLTPKKKEVLLINKLKNMIKDIWMWFETVGSPKGVRAYFVPKDSEGKIKGKQEIDLEDPVMAVKALYSSLYTAGIIKKTDWGEISSIPDKKFI